MGMVVRSNVMAVNAFRQLGMNNSQVSKSLEKLSSGFRINRAGDDASGLAISEKMKAQIKGLETASSNSQDGISLIQTAEGALTEVHDMLNRMVELSMKSANGTMDDSIDRDSLQKEMTALKDEINRIAEGTNFNGLNLLDGSLGGPKTTGTDGVATVDAVPGTPGAAPTATAPTTATTKNETNGDGTTTKASFEIDFTGASITAPTDGSTGAKAAITVAGQKIELDVTADMDADAIAAALNDKEITLNNGTDDVVLKATTTGKTVKFEALTTDSLTIAAGGTVTIGSTAGTIGGTPGVTGSAASVTMDFDGRVGADLIGGTMKLGGTTYSFVKAGDTAPTGTTAIQLNATDTAEQIATAIAAATVTGYTGAATGTKVTFTQDADANGKFDGAKAPSAEFAGIGLTLQIGDTSDSFNKLTVSVKNMSCEGLGIDGISIKSQTAASAALDAVKKGASSAINQVSAARADLGALQNRLEHTINNLDVAAENMTAANSRIRDTDMAKQMMEYTKMNVLTQAAQAMLAQANQQPQSVLQLLQ